MVVYLLTTGDGSDGHEWQLHGVYDSEEAANIAKAHYERERHRPDGSTYRDFANGVEPWMVQDRYDAEGDAKKDMPAEARS